MFGAPYLMPRAVPYWELHFAAASMIGNLQILPCYAACNPSEPTTEADLLHRSEGRGCAAGARAVPGGPVPAAGRRAASAPMAHHGPAALGVHLPQGEWAACEFVMRSRRNPGSL